MQSIEDALLSDAYISSPYETFDILRRKHPVYWSDKWNAWVITRYDDAVAVLRDVARFSNQNRYTNYLSPLPPDQREQLTYLQKHYEKGGLVQSDPPAHTRLRKLVGGAFTPRIIAHMDEMIRETVDQLIAAFEHDDEVELIHQFAFPLPAMVIAGILGVPREDRDMFKVWSSDVQNFLGSGTINFELALKAQDAWRNLNNYFSDLLASRRKQPRNDLVSTMAGARDEGQQLADDELIRTCGAMLIAGHETTTNLISNGLWLLLTHPEQKESLLQDESLYPSAVEEFLRYESPFQMVPRTITTDVEMEGCTLRAGQLAYVMVGSANRDPDRFPDPQKFDICRKDNRHIAFGYGIHFCLGAALARMEAPIAIQSLLQRKSRIALCPKRPPTWKVSMVQRGMEEFWLRLQ